MIPERFITARQIAYSFLLVAVTTTSFLMTQSQVAQACRDCPFPTRIDETHWLMPNSRVVMVMTQKKYSNGRIRVRVALKDTVDGEIFARGQGWLEPGQTEIWISMRDPKGHHVDGRITWVNPQERVIQADFDCLESRTCGESKVPGKATVTQGE